MLRPAGRRARARPHDPSDRLRGGGHVLPLVLQDLALPLTWRRRAMSKTTARIVFALTALRNSLLLACAGTSLALLIALPLAYVSDRFLFPLKGFLNSAVLVPMILPPFVGAIGIKQIFGQYGAVNALIVDLGLRHRGW